ncbi:MAG: Thymidylate kinase [Burkholderiaceae bacterium]|jgi:dTMP kinase|nr:MAG: Thymidylate kinase [Burkholderiaceae bacterium]
MHGLFITLEGIDGAGKSTHLDALADAFRARGRTVTRTREPGGTPLAEKLRTLVLCDAMDPLTEALLMFAARRDHLLQVIAPALERGEVVLCDRFTDASFAYQGGGRGFDRRVLSIMEQWVQNLPGLEPDLMLEPDLTLWFDLAPELAAERLSLARAPDRFEGQPLEFFRRVRDGYAERAAEAPQRIVRIDASGAPDAVWRQIVDLLRRRGELGDVAGEAPR